jgi:hypothetical protein
VLGEPAPRWPTTDQLPPVAEARAGLAQAEETLARLEAEAAAARAAASARAPTAEDLHNYARSGKVPGRDRDAAQAAERAAGLAALLGLARAEVAARKAALAGALQDAPAAVGAAVDPEHKRALRAWAAGVARAVLGQLRLRGLEQDCVAHFRACGLRTDRYVPLGFAAHGVHFGPDVFSCLLDGTHPMMSLEIFAAFEALRAAKFIDYPPLDDPRELGLARVSERALRGLHKILEVVAAQGEAGPEPEPTPEPQKPQPKGD